MKHIILLFFLTMSFAVYSQIVIDLNNATLNDSIDFVNLTIDELTNELGRPSLVDSPHEYVAHIIGPSIYYHEHGLAFHFYPQKEGTKEQIEKISVYLSRTWNKTNNKYYLPYSEELTPSLNANMKIKDVLPKFSNDSTKLETAEEYLERLKPSLKGITIDANYDYIFVYKENYEVVLCHEKLTKYLEMITFQFKK